MRNLWYMLDADGNPQPTSIQAVERMMTRKVKVVATDGVTERTVGANVLKLTILKKRFSEDEIRISTIFLGLDHNIGEDGPPVLFETMVFGGAGNQTTERYTTHAAAVAGHTAIVVTQRKINSVWWRLIKRIRDAFP